MKLGKQGAGVVWFSVDLFQSTGKKNKVKWGKEVSEAWKEFGMFYKPVKSSAFGKMRMFFNGQSPADYLELSPFRVEFTNKEDLQTMKWGQWLLEACTVSMTNFKHWKSTQVHLSDIQQCHVIS